MLTTLLRGTCLRREVAVSGTAAVPLPVATLWPRLRDPRVLRRALPGCRSLAAVPHRGDVYDVVLTAGVGPVRGTSRGTLTLVDEDGPSRYRLVVDGDGVTGYVHADVTFELADDGPHTHVRYGGHAEVVGALGSVGGPVLASATRHAIERFFAQVVASEALARPRVGRG